MKTKGQQNLIGVGIILLIVVVAVALNQGFNFNPFSTVFAVTGCTDSDGLDPYTKGNANGVSDFCYSSSKVMEQYCSASERKAQVITCESGSCVDGKCTGGTSTLTPPPTTPTTTPTYGTCSGTTSPTAECCKNSPECGYKELFGYQELTTAFCGSDGNLYGNYFEWGCSSQQCVKGTLRSKKIEICSNGCESLGEFGAQCKVPKCTYTSDKFIDCEPGTDFDYVTVEKCIDGQTSQYKYNCPSGQKCVDGVGCQQPTTTPACTNECSTQGTVCAGTTSYVTCGNFDSDSCLEPKASSCQSGAQCYNIGSNQIACYVPTTQQCTDGTTRNLACKSTDSSLRWYEQCQNNQWITKSTYCPSGTECKVGSTTCTSGDCSSIKGSLPADQCSADGTKVLTSKFGTYPTCSISTSTKTDCAAQNKICKDAVCVDKTESLHSCSVTATPVLIKYKSDGSFDSALEDAFPTFSVTGVTPSTKIVNVNGEARISLTDTVTKYCTSPKIRVKVQNTDPLTGPETSTLNSAFSLQNDATKKLIEANPATCYDQEFPVSYNIRFKSGIAGKFNFESSIECGGEIISETDRFTITVQGGADAETCGNKVREGFEVCDGPDLGGKSCSSYSGLTGDNLQCSSDCKSVDKSQCEAEEQFCSDGTAYGECSEVSSEMECSNGKLIPSSACCSKTGLTLDPDTNKCVGFTDCKFGTDTIECKLGVERQCTSANVWRQTETCEQEFCDLDEGCIATVENNQTQGQTGGEEDLCAVDSCSEGCDRTHLEKVCGQIGNEYKVYDNKCSALEEEATIIGTESICQAISQQQGGQGFQFPGGTVVAIGIGVGILLVLLAFARPR